MKILLVNPKIKYKARVGTSTFFPLGLLSIAGAAIKKGFRDILLLDFNIESFEEGIRKAVGFRPDIVGITCWLDNFSSAKKIGETVKKETDAKIVVGGPFATVAPEFFLGQSWVDIVVCGEGENIFTELLELKFHKRSQFSSKTVKSKHIYDINESDNPYYLLSVEKYVSEPYPRAPGKKYAIAIASRGCPYRCSFCGQGYLGPLRIKDQVLVRQDLGKIKSYGVELILFGDATFTHDRRFVFDLCQNIRNMGIEWICMTRSNALDQEMLYEMREAGCKEIWVGVESIDEQMLKLANKGVSIEQNKKAIDMIRKANIMPVAFVLFGLPGDTETSIHRTLEFVRSNKIFAAPNVLFPIPGTQIWNYAKSLGKAPLIAELPDLYEKYDNGDRIVPMLNLSDTNDEVLAAAAKEIIAHNATL